MMKYARFLTSEHEIITQLQKRDWKLRKVYTLVQEEDKHSSFFMEGVKFSLYHGGSTLCLDNNVSEAEVITDPKESRKVNH